MPNCPLPSRSHPLSTVSLVLSITLTPIACTVEHFECGKECEDPPVVRDPKVCIKRTEINSTCGDGSHSWDFSCIDSDPECEGRGTEVDQSLYCHTRTHTIAWYEPGSCYEWEAAHLLEVQKVTPSVTGTCNLTGTNADCTTCANHCCDHLADCLEDRECVDFLNCLTDCPKGDLECPRACKAASNGGLWNGEKYVDCVAACSCP